MGEREFPAMPCSDRPGSAEPATTVPDVGTLAYDSRSGRVGRVMAMLAGQVMLRPPAGGLEWEVAPGDLRPASRTEELRSRVAELNAAKRSGL
jgi:hypothetical protein